jgi:hypothetical protein
VQAGNVSYSFLFPGAGKPPTPTPDGDKVIVGQQIVSIQNGQLHLAR